MKLTSKLAIAFGASLLVTLTVVVGTQWAARLIKLENMRLQLSQQQLHTFETLLAMIARNESALTRYTLSPKAETLTTALAAGRSAESLVRRLIEQNRNELALLEGNSRASKEDLVEERLEGARLASLHRLLQTLNRHASSVNLKNAPAARPQHFAKTIVGLLNRIDDEGLYKLVEKFERQEIAAVRRRQTRLDALLTKMVNLSAVAAAVAGVICIGAISLLSSSIRELHASREREQAANTAKSAFLANMSHEIRTPLNGILGFTQLLMRKPELAHDSDTQQYLVTIYSSSQHLLNLINDILDLSKVEAGRFECRREDFDVLHAFEEVISFLRVRANAKSITLEFEWQGRVPPTICSDAARFKQVLINLVGNAIKFTEVGGVFVDAHVERDPDGWRLVTHVSDTGIGISKEQQDLIFEPFRQADASITRQFEGTGLGLSISKRLAQIMGGNITVESTLGEGSTFSVSIDPGPIDVTKMTDIPSARFARPQYKVAEGEVEVSLAGRKILVVDDGKTNRDLIRIVLTNADAEVLEADNGLKGIKLSIANKFDMILMDVQMPVMDGLTATARLRQQGFAGPILALTAHAMEGDRQRCIDAGCSGYLSKPVDPDQLLTEIARQFDVPVHYKPAAATVTTVFPSPTTVAQLKSSLPADVPEFMQIAQEFVSEFAARLDRIDELRRGQDWDGVATDAHFIKGAGGTAGFEALTAPAGRLEQAARMIDAEQADRAIRELRALLESIPSEYRPVVTSVV